MSDVGVLNKVMAILYAFPEGSSRLQPPEVAERLDLATPTAYRLMKGMAEHGLLERGSDGYRLGMTLLKFGARVAEGLDLSQAARPYLAELRNQTGENAELHVRHGAMRVPIEVVTSAQNLRPMGRVGVPWPLTAGASSKVLLAWLPEQEREELIRTSLETSPPAKHFDLAHFERDLTRTRKRGWASSDGERESGVSSVAAPVYDHGGSVVAAMVVSAPTSRLGRSAARARAGELASAAAGRLSQAIGADPNGPTRRPA